MLTLTYFMEKMLYCILKAYNYCFYTMLTLIIWEKEGAARVQTRKVTTGNRLGHVRNFYMISLLREQQDFC